MRRLVILTFTVGVGCARPSVGLFDPSLRLAPTCAEVITLHSDPAKAPAGYKEIALLTNYGHDSAAIEQLRTAAAGVGATDVILGATSGIVYRGTTVGSRQDAIAAFSPADTASAYARCAAAAAARAVVTESDLKPYYGDRVILRNATGIDEPWLSQSELSTATDSTITLRVGNLERVVYRNRIARIDTQAFGPTTRVVILLKL